MNKCIAIGFIFIIPLLVNGQGQWIWMKGDSTMGSNNGTNGIYGTQGIPDSMNCPPSRYGSACWRDNNNNLWMYSGAYFDMFATKWVPYIDMWQYNPAIDMWTWINSLGFGLPSYGIQGVSDSANTPGPRCNSATWIDLQGNFWLFGGSAHPGSIIGWFYNDLWKYDPLLNQWTWINGPNTINQPEIYGTEGVPDSANTPGGRWLSETWVDDNGNFWLFGGYREYQGNGKWLNDLWKYDPLTNQWAWMKGDTIPDQGGNYGVQGIGTTATKPGCRQNNHLHWKDENGNLILFGGWTLEPSQGYFDDVWQYDIASNIWTWISGTNLQNYNGNYGIECIPDALLNPCTRTECSGWIDSNNDLWLFGGEGNLVNPNFIGNIPDLWKFNAEYLQWARVAEINLPIIGNYGTQGVASSNNYPRGRIGAAAWIDTSGNFWLFGGAIEYDDTYDPTLNDLWVYTPDTICGVFTTLQQPFMNEQIYFSVFPNPAADQIYLSQAITINTSIQVFNTMGQIVLQTTSNSNEPIDVSALPAGFYSLLLTSEEKRQTISFIKQ